MTRSGIAVVAPNRLAVDAGIEVAEQGGSAVDAAMAALLVTTVTEPGMISALGGAFVSVWPVGGDPVVIDGNVAMPGLGASGDRTGAGLHEVTSSYAGGMTTYGGYGSVAVPGMFAALDTASRMFGRVPWPELFPAAIAAARDGFRLGGTVAYYLTLMHELFTWHPESAAFLDQGRGRLPVEGDLMRSSELADAFSHIADAGAHTLYVGDLAAGLLAASDAGGGLLTARDLREYRAASVPPLMSRLGSWTLATTPPPAVGGPCLGAMLHLLERAEKASDSVDMPEGELVARIQQTVLTYRDRHIDRAADLGEAGRELMRLIDSGTFDTGALGSGSPNTVNVSAASTDGTVCAITASAGYGSGATIPGTGLVLNNALGEIELNRRGMHALAPGRRIASNMAPTVGRHDDGSRLAIGSPGSDRITTAIFQVLRHLCLDRMSLQEAVDAPRLHVRVDGQGGVGIQVERSDLVDEVAGVELDVTVHDPHSMYFGGVGAAVVDPDGGLSVAGDPRRSVLGRVA